MEASNEFAALMEARLADFPSWEEIENHLLSIQQIRVDLEAARAKEQQYGKEVEELKERLSVVKV